MGINIDTFGDKIDILMSSIPHAGYAYYIMTRNPALVLKGFQSRWLSRGGSQGAASVFANPTLAKFPFFVEMTVDTRLETASMSKTITAAAVIKAVAKAQADKVHQLAKGLDSLIMPLLPSTWIAGSFAKDLTIRHLLEHRSGLVQAQSGLVESRWDYMQLRLFNGVPPPSNSSTIVYQNVNYGLLRIILAYIVGDPDKMNQAWIGVGLGMSSIESFDLMVGSKYVTYIKDNILTPIGISNADVEALTSPVRYYMGDDLASPSIDNAQFLFDAGAVKANGQPSSLLVCGGALWKLSASEYCRFVASLTHGGLGLAPSTWDNEMKNPKHYIGLNDHLYEGVLGEYFGKLGALRTLNSNGVLCGTRSCWLWFPPALVLKKSKVKDVVAVLLINSIPQDDIFDPNYDSGSHPAQILGWAHDWTVLEGIETQ